MPRIQISINNFTFRIDSSDRDTIRAWLAETLRWVPGTTADYCTLAVYPLPKFARPDDAEPGLDWPITDADWVGRQYDLSPKGIEQFAADMRKALTEAGLSHGR